MSDTHAARPTDLVALVSFEGEVRRNQAVTREHLGRTHETAHPLNAALEQWLGLGRKTWITVEGRQIQGIATARELSARTAWQLDTLVDADASGQHHVLADLLRQAVVSATHARATHVVLRTPADSPAVEQARRAGFAVALVERLWAGTPRTPEGARPVDAVDVREESEADGPGVFQLHSRAVPVETREALAMTFDEWAAVRERRWCDDRGSHHLVAAVEGRVTGTLRTGRADHVPQIELMVERDQVTGLASGRALLARLPELVAAGPLLALCATGATVTEALLAEHGLEPRDEYVLLSRRIAQPVRDPAPARAGIAMPTGG